MALAQIELPLFAAAFSAIGLADELALEVAQAEATAGSASLVESLKPVSGAHEHSRFIGSSVAAGYEMLWKSAVQD